MQFFFRNCTYTLTRTQRKKFEDMFLVKIASKGTSLKQSNSPLTLYLFNEQVVREKHVLGHTCHGLDN